MVPHDLDETERETVADLLRDFYQRSGRVIDRIMAAKGASYARARILLEIRRNGSLRSTDLASTFSYAPRTVTEAVDGLERDGMVRRDADPDDRRAKRISLTAAGLAAAEGAEAARLRYVEDVFGILCASERQEIIRVIGKLNARLLTLGG